MSAAPFSESAEAIIALSPNGDLPRTRLSKSRKTRRQLSPIVEVSPALPAKRKKAIQALSPQFVVPSSALSQDQAGHRVNDTREKFASLILEIRETHRRRQDFHRAEKSLTLQIKAIERRLSGARSDLPPNLDVPRDPSSSEDHTRYDVQLGAVDAAPLDEEQDAQVASANHHNRGVLFFATAPLDGARKVIKTERLAVERQVKKLAKQLPVWPWVEAINGFGALGLAQIVGEAGDLSNYENPAKLWKRMGLAVFNGKSQRRVAGAGAIEQGYSPVRRSIMFCIGDSLLKKQNEYRELYLARKALEQAKLPDGTKMHWHRRAQRYAEKRLLRNLWRAWRGHSHVATHKQAALPALQGAA